MARIVLTEEQLNQVLEEGLMDMFRNVSNPEEARKKIKRAIAAGVSVAVILTAIGRASLSDEAKHKLADMVTTEQMQTDSLFDQKVNAVRDYMAFAAKNQNFDPETIQISPEAMVKACWENDFDLVLMLAQAHEESCFGLTNRARRTNSVFSVGSYDNGKNACVYPSQDASILPYINLMKNDYLANKSIPELLQPGNFTNGLNKRYASNPRYESDIKSIMARIRRMYPILGS